ncbi:MAG: NAD(P)H-hydrate dehydratase [Planctomycetes bacterium]|nr:NAD(P)H-hydrate dehydratase [Planctomycetota bacterium]
MTDWTPPSLPELPVDAHKGDAGRVLLVAGSAWMPGAAILAARAAQRAGAGLVGVLVTDDLLRHVLPQAAPESVLVDPSTLDLSPGKWHAGLVGPGIGLGEPARNLVRRIIAEFDAPLVIDADALTVLAQEPGLARKRRSATVVTPHAGEAARLLAREVPGEPTARSAAAREIAQKTGAICCLKGQRTVVATGERVYVNQTGNNGLATAGAGDVLAGIATAYLALVTTLENPRFTAFDAAARAVWVHGRAGDLARAARVSRSLIASDLIDSLSSAQNA